MILQKLSNHKWSETWMAAASVFCILLLTAATSSIDFNFISALQDDQTTLYYAYSQAFANSFCDTGHFIGWNPWLSSGSNEFANLPLPFSLTKLFAIVFCDGGLGYLLGTFVSLSVGAICIVRLCDKLGMNFAGQAAALALLLTFSRYFGLAESQPIYIGALIFNAQLSFANRPRISYLLVNALITGALINNHVAQGVLTLIGLNAVFLVLMATSTMGRRMVSASAVLWVIGIAMAMPTLLPQIVDARESSKTLTPWMSVNGGILRFFQLSFLQISALSFWMVGSIVVAGALWNSLAAPLRKLIIAACLLWIPTALFITLQPVADVIPVIGKVLATIDPTRFTFTFRFVCILILSLTASVIFATFHNRLPKLPIGFDVRSFIFTILPGATFILLGNFGNKLTILLIVELAILYVALNLRPTHLGCTHSGAEQIQQNFWLRANGTNFGGKLLALMFAAPIVAFLVISVSYPSVLDGKFSFKLENPKHALEVSARPIVFTLETPEENQRLLSFLGRMQAKHPWQIAELRDLRQPSGVFQSYAAYRISTIHGFRNLRPLRAHIFYTWLLDDLRTSDPAAYKEMLLWGSFTYSYGSRYLLNLLSLTGTKYLISPVSDTDNRFVTVQRGSNVQVYENRAALERVFFSPGIKIVPNLEKLGIEIKSSKVKDLQERILLLESDNITKIRPGKRNANCGEALVSLNKFEPDKILVDAQSNCEGFLVMTQNYHRGWRAFVNGIEQPILPAYYAFQAIALQPGHSVVEFRFSDPLVTYGLLLALFSILVCPIALFWARDTNGLQDRIK
jgi:hypothetical protein